MIISSILRNPISNPVSAVLGGGGNPNLFNKDTITPDTFAGKNGVEATSATYARSDYIRVVEGQTYYGVSDNNPIRMYTAFDNNKVRILDSGSDAATNKITIPSGVKYLRITVYTSNIDSFIFSKPTHTLAWNGKKWGSFGDSVTQGNAWQPSVISALNLLHINYGIGGTRISGSAYDAMHQDARINAIAADRDLVTFMGGTNDWAQSVVLGASDSSDTNNFYGALNAVATKLKARFPTEDVMFMTTPYGEFTEANGIARGWDDGITNSIGLTTRDYAAAVRVVAANHGLRVIDIDANSGIDTTNVDENMSDDGNHFHPNAIGGAKFSNVVLDVLRAFYPVGEP